MINIYRNKEIPSLDSKRKKVINFRNVKIDFSRNKANEDFIDIRDAGLSGDNFYYKKNNPPYYKRIDGSIEGLYLRKSIIDKLVRINTKLNKFGLELYFFDCYRPVEVQKFFYDIWYPEYLRRIYPNISEVEVQKKREYYTAKGPDSKNEIDKYAPPPHTTGAAADLTLRFIKSKELLFMGTIFDDATELVHTDYYEKIQNDKILSLSEEEAQKNRRILYWLMKEEEFENYPYEWWHFCWGDQMWAILSENNKAFYSNMNI